MLRDTLVDIVRPPRLSYLPRLRELIASLDDNGDPFLPQHTPSVGRVTFVRLVFQSADGCLKAHQQLEPALVDLPSNLLDSVRVLEKAAGARNHDHGLLLRVVRSISGKSTRSIVERALSDVESYPFTNAYQIVVSGTLLRYI
jgi:hypothetical protein